MTSAAALADPDALDDLARQALSSGEEEAAIPILRAGAIRHASALLWQWTGLLERSIDEHESAFQSFTTAARLAPNDPVIAHGLARVALEAGLDAVRLFERARTLAPANGDVLLGLAAARNAIGDGARASDELAAVLHHAPRWIAGHEQLAQLRSTIGEKERATESLGEALAAAPQSEALWTGLFGLHLRREDYPALRQAVEQAAAAGVPDATLVIWRAICASELNDELFPRSLFDAAPAETERSLGLWRIRHLLRVGAVDAALPLIDQELSSDRPADAWPYASIAWRLSGDPRSEWLEGDDRFVSVLDLNAALPSLESLAATLRALHVAKGEYLDQSVRGGTQTDGPLLSRIDPVIRDLRRVIVQAVEDHVARLPAADPDHPLLGRRRDRRIRFSGSWSVRLRSGGRHSNHVHPQGWISSALYVALPQNSPEDADDAGWLTLGEPPENLSLDLPPQRKVEPRPGQLVLFPSWMWHGTLPFASGERLTVAFDVAPPR
jgi:tetratricopeptide (TPR) repeat protein